MSEIRVPYTRKTTLVAPASVSDSLFLTMPEDKRPNTSKIIMDSQPINGPGYKGDSSRSHTKRSKASTLNHLFAYTDLYGRSGDIDILKDLIRGVLKKFHKDFFIEKYREIGRTKSTLDQFITFMNEMAPLYAEAFSSDDLFRIVTSYVEDRLYLDEEQNEYEYKLSAKDIFVLVSTSVIIKLVEVMANPLGSYLSPTDNNDIDSIQVAQEKLTSHLRNMMSYTCVLIMGKLDSYCTHNIYYLNQYTDAEFDTAENLADHVEYKVKASNNAVMESYINSIHVSNGTTLSRIKDDCFIDAMKSVVTLVPTVGGSSDKSIAKPLNDFIEELLIIDPPTENFRRINELEVGMEKGDFIREFGFNMVQVSSHIVSRIHDDRHGVINQKVFMQITPNRSVVANNEIAEELMINSPADHRRTLEIKDFIIASMKRELPDNLDISDRIKFSKGSKSNSSPLAMFLIGDSLERIYGHNVSKYMTETELKFVMSYLFYMDPILNKYQLKDIFLSNKSNATSNIPKGLITDNMLNENVRFMKDSLFNLVKSLATNKYHRFSLQDHVDFDIPYYSHFAEYLIAKVNGEL